MTSAVRQTRPIERLLFVYKANSGRLNAVVDSARKVLRLNGCTLCEITHGLAGEKHEWRECKAELGVPVDYVHLDELDASLRSVIGEDVPAVVARVDAELVPLLGPDVLARGRGSVEDLRARILFHANRLNLTLPIA